MKIGFNIFFNGRYLSGVDYYSLGLIRALRENSYLKFYVFTNRAEIVKKYVGNENLKIINLSFIRFRLLRILIEHLFLPLMAWWYKLDVLHCPAYICPLWSIGTKYVVTVHDTIAIDSPGFCTFANAVYYTIFMRLSIRSASAVVAVSNDTRIDIIKNFPAYSEKIRVIYPGIDKCFTSVLGKKMDLAVLRKYDLPKNYILYVGNIEPKKNLLDILIAYKRIACDVNFKLVIAGRRSWKSCEVYKFIEENFQDDQVILAGYVERADLPGLYRCAKALVFNSHKEGFGFPPLEAMACGTPVISRKVGILKEFADNCYFEIKQGGEETLSDLLIKLAHIKAIHNENAHKSYVKIKSYCWQNTARKTTNLYDEVSETIKKPVAYILDTYPNPSEQFIHREIRELEKLNHDIYILASKKVGAFHNIENVYIYPNKNLSTKLKLLLIQPLYAAKLLVYIFSILRHSFPDARLAAGAFFKILFFVGIVKKKKVKHIHCGFLSWPGLMGLCVSKLTSVQFSISAHAQDVFVEQGSLIMKGENCTVIRCCNLYAANHLKRKLDTSLHHKIKLIHHGINTFTGKNENCCGHDRIFAAGRFVKKKGFNFLINTFADVVRKNPNLNLVIAGAGPEEANLKKLIYDLKIHSNVNFAGWLDQEEIFKQLQISKMLIVPSIVDESGDVDGIPNIILEGFATFTPVVASNVGGIGEVLKHNRTGLLFEPEDGVMMRKCVARVLTNESFTSSLTRNAFELLQKEFDITKNVKEFSYILKGEEVA